MWILEHASGALVGAWQVAARMAPYLLFGFAMAGLLHVWLPAAWVARHLGGSGFRAAVKAALLGVPLPLCSCSVIPVAVSIRRQGAGRGATAAFLMSTPQTGVDSLLVTYGLLGPVFAVVRPVVAFLSGALCGVAVDRLTSGGEMPTGAGSTASRGSVSPWWVRALRHGFRTLPSDIGRELLGGILVAGLVGAVVPADYLADKLPRGLSGMLVIMAVGIPMYVCSTASVPIALGLMQAGVSPGAALVFLITGPATNAATIGALGRLLGPRAGIVYLACLAATALAAGAVIDLWVLPMFPASVPDCHVGNVSGWEHVAAILLVAVIVAARIPSRPRPSPPSPESRGSCCTCAAPRA